MRKNRLSILPVVALSLLTSALAHAEDAVAFGDQGQLVFSAERLVNLFEYNRLGFDTTTGSGSTSATTFSLLTAGVNPGSTYAVPRLAFDYTVIPHLTIGGSAWVFATLGSSTSNNVTTGVMTGGVTTTNDSTKYTFLGIAPRVGYVLNLGEHFAFWPRAGFSYSSLVISPAGNNGNESITQLAIDLEPMFAILPVPHAGIAIGPVFDIPLTGSITDNANNGTSLSVSSAQFMFGVTGGLFIYF